jgi:hypothetical protein
MATDRPQGGGSGFSEPGVPAASAPPGHSGVQARPGPSSPPGRAAERAGWTLGRVIALVAGSVLVLGSLVLLGGSGAGAWADQQQRGGYASIGTATYSTSGYALASDPVRLPGGWSWLGWLVGDVRIRVTATSPARPVFVAIAPAADVSRYLTGVSCTTVTAFGDPDVARHPGIAVPASPATAVDWSVRAEGTGSQTLQWTARAGDWMVVVMNPDGSPGVTVRADVGVSAPALPWLATGLLVAGIVADLLAAALILIPVRLAMGRR